MALFLSYPSVFIYLFSSLYGSHLVLIRCEILLVTNRERDGREIKRDIEWKREKVEVKRKAWVKKRSRDRLGEAEEFNSQSFNRIMSVSRRSRSKQGHS